MLKEVKHFHILDNTTAVSYKPHGFSLNKVKHNHCFDVSSTSAVDNKPHCLSFLISRQHVSTE